jgi:EAL domain-containing protein (putative c-di-GMP-specific phosphodiesterase class I)
MMSTQLTEKNHIKALRDQLHEALYLDLDDYGLEQPRDGEFSSTFLGIRLNSAFQPIYDSAAGELFGHEALLRAFLGNDQEISPEFAFSFSAQSGRLVKFDRICRTLHLLNFRQIFQDTGRLFLNVHPELLLNVNAHGKVFERILHANSVPTNRVVIEVRESAIEADGPLAEAVENYRDRKYKIAIDGLGQKHGNLSRLWQLAPDFVKLDKTVVQQAETNPKLRKALRHLIGMIRDLGAQPVIQGIETQTQLDIAIETGSTLLQGYLLGKPVTVRQLQPTKVFKPTTPVAA